MRLSDFIVQNREPILAEWEAFARTCLPACAGMDIAALRDHAGEMLTAIAADLTTPQNHFEQAEKSKGNAPAAGGGAATAAEEHGAGRAESGFTVEQMVAEYRALRASVLRLWAKAQGEVTPADLEDVTRFNEAIDQSLAESVTRYTQDLNQSKDMFLAILGHDLRTPLAAIVTSVKFITGMQALEEPYLTLMSRIVRSSTRMSAMVGDLLDFTRSRLGGGIPITRAPMSMAGAAQDVADEIAAAHPGREIRVESRGEQRGEWDPARIGQVLTNLLANAVEHGSAAMPTRLCVDGEDHGDVTVTVHNHGPAIPAERLEGVFNPMKARDARGSSGADGPSGSLGLGLYIAERIVAAHNGRIEVESSDDRGTTFTVHLPRRG